MSFRRKKSQQGIHGTLLAHRVGIEQISWVAGAVPAELSVLGSPYADDRNEVGNGEDQDDGKE
jgi:hypothetical protein